MLKVNLFLALLGIAFAGGDSFFEKYAYSKIMRSCFGEERYAGYENNVLQDIVYCKKQVQDKRIEGEEPGVQINEEPFRKFIGSFAVNQTQSQTMYTTELMKVMVKKVQTKAEILMCVSKKMQLLDGNGNINTAIMKHPDIIGVFDQGIQTDLISLVDKCNEVSKCVDGKDSPLPIELQRVIAFFKCSEAGKVSVCMKADLRKKMAKLGDFSGFLEQQEGNMDDKAENLLHVFLGADPGTDPMELLA